MNDILLTPIRLNELEILIQNSVQKAIEIVQGNDKISYKESEDKLLNVEEAAKFLHLAVPTIRSKASRKELPFMKRGKLLYFSQKELTDYLKKGKVKSNDEIEAEADKYFSKKIKK